MLKVHTSEMSLWMRLSYISDWKTVGVQGSGFRCMSLLPRTLMRNVRPVCSSSSHVRVLALLIHTALHLCLLRMMVSTCFLVGTFFPACKLLLKYDDAVVVFRKLVQPPTSSIWNEDCHLDRRLWCTSRHCQGAKFGKITQIVHVVQGFSA